MCLSTKEKPWKNKPETTSSDAWMQLPQTLSMHISDIDIFALGSIIV